MPNSFEQMKYCSYDLRIVLEDLTKAGFQAKNGSTLGECPTGENSERPGKQIK